MEIRKEILDKWASIRVHGDAMEIAKMAGVRPRAIYNAMKTGKMSLKTLDAIVDFYAKRSKQLK